MEPTAGRPKRTPLLVLVQVVVALGATLGYLVVVLPDYGYEPAWPLNVGCTLFLGLLWWLAIRGGHRLMKPGLAIGLAGFVLLIVGEMRMTSAENELRGELDRSQYERLATDGRKFFNEEDAFEKELETAFGTDIYENRPTNFVVAFDPATLTVKTWEPKPGALESMAARVEERKPGWPRILRAFERKGFVELPSRDRRESYYGHVQVACGHYFSTIGNFTRYKSLKAHLRAEDRVMKLAEADRELFLKAWKNRPVER